MKLQKANSNQIPMHLERLSQSTLCNSLAAGEFKKVSESLPTTILQAIEQPPISQIEKVVGRGKIILFLKVELIKLSERITVSGNITPSQLEFVSTQLVEFFPNETLADFKLCFERGCMGQYGEIYRMDGIVIRKWMEKYLDEKYQVVEAQLMKQKDVMYVKPVVQDSETDWLSIWKDTVTNVAGKAIAPMTDEEIKRIGKDKPPAKNYTGGYKYFTVKNLQVMAITQEHAEELVELMIKRGDIIEE